VTGWKKKGRKGDGVQIRTTKRFEHSPFFWSCGIISQKEEKKKEKKILEVKVPTSIEKFTKGKELGFQGEKGGETKLLIQYLRQ